MMFSDHMPMARKTRDWDTYFLDLARQAATRSSCTQQHHGAVIVNNRHVRSTGYNGTPSGHGNCNEGGCPRGVAGDKDEPCLGLHAEANAILYSDPAQREGATLYITRQPCLECAKLIANSGLREVVVPQPPPDEPSYAKEFLLDCKVRVRFV